jgi:gamma-glutamyltranspeptidase / glutathione hydrolase
MQPQGHVQLLLNVLRGFSVQAAVDAPRFCISGGVPAQVNPSSAGDVNSEVYFESEIPDAVVKELNGQCAVEDSICKADSC